MIKIYQYKWTPVTTAGLNNFVGTGILAIPVTEYIINIQALDTQKDDLDAYMTSISFTYVGEII